ncbi:PREDICTED: uncharacterized protein LOC108686918 [Atta colombica]|uniref:uncharacterized protein LOC108686918 n=1 Tax=Atta colombica TaxID=520822 RepID=UPI00084C30BA|nr:PREDICTED: uncharacterized protein LOC108686918 [Atta colombica]
MRRRPLIQYITFGKMSDIYCISCKQLSDDNHRNVFDDKLLLNLQEKDTHEKPDGYMTLRDAIELITGHTISEIDNAILCKICFYKVESYIKFRSQLVASFGKLNIQISDCDSLNLTSVDTNTNSLISKITSTESEIFKEIMNVNENSISSNCSINLELSSNETSLCLSDFHHYVDNVSDDVSDIDDYLNVDISRSRIQKSDIESDINVCSCEDDEILELPVEYKHSEIINISSTESEEDYDYGPTFKKIKLSNQISPPVLSS